MKANILHGIKEPIRYEEVEMPIGKTGEILIRLHASALNRRDYWIQQGQYAGLKFPIILGSDGAGEIVSASQNDAFKNIEKEVILNPGMNWGEKESAQSFATFKILGLPDNGTFAEYASVPAEYVYPKPKHLTYTQAAALPLAGVTAYRALFSRVGLQAGEKVLITGIGGGVALFALQFAVAAGAEVWVTSGSEEKIAKAKTMGAKGGISYHEPKWAKTLVAESGNFDVILDSAGGDGFPFLLDLAAYGGRIATYGGTRGAIPLLSPQKIFWKQLSVFGTTMGSQKDFSAMLNFVNKHAIVPFVDTIFPLSEANAAIQSMENSKQFGKIVLNHE